MKEQGPISQLRHTNQHDTIPYIFVLLTNREVQDIGIVPCSFVCLSCVRPLILSFFVL